MPPFRSPVPGRGKDDTPEKVTLQKQSIQLSKNIAKLQKQIANVKIAAKYEKLQESDQHVRALTVQWKEALQDMLEALLVHVQAAQPSVTLDGMLEK